MAKPEPTMHAGGSERPGDEAERFTPPSVASGGLEALLGRGGVLLSQMLMIILTGRFMGPSGRGVYALASLSIGLCQVPFGSVWVANAVELARRRATARELSGVSVVVALVAGVLTSAVACAISTLLGDRWWVLALPSLVTPFVLLRAYQEGLFQALGHVRAVNFLRVGRSFLAVLFIAPPILAGASTRTTIVVWELSFVVLAVTAFFRLRAFVGAPVFPRDHGVYHRVTRYGLTISGFRIVEVLNERNGLLFLAAFATDATVGVFSIAVAATEVLLLSTDALQLSTFKRIGSDSREASAALSVRTTRHCILLAAAGAIVVIPIAYFAIPWVLGSGYDEVPLLLVLLLPNVLCQAARCRCRSSRSGREAGLDVPGGGGGIGGQRGHEPRACAALGRTRGGGRGLACRDRCGQRRLPRLQGRDAGAPGRALAAAQRRHGLRVAGALAAAARDGRRLMAAPSAAPLALVMGDVDMVRALGIAGIQSAFFGFADDSARFSRHVRASLPWIDQWERQPELVQALLELARSQPRAPVLFPQTDATLLLASRHREQLAEGLRLMLANPDLIEQLVDKGRFEALAARRELPVPRAQRLEPAPGDPPPPLDVPFPVVIKPLTRTPAWSGFAGSSKALHVLGRRGLRRPLAEAGRLAHGLLASSSSPGPSRASRATTSMSTPRGRSPVSSPAARSGRSRATTGRAPRSRSSRCATSRRWVATWLPGSA